MDNGTGRRLFPSRDTGTVELQHFTSRSFEVSDELPNTTFPQFQENNEHLPLKSLPSTHQGCCSDKTSLRMIVISLITASVALTVALVIEIYNGEYVMLKYHSAIVSDNPLCTKAGISILKKGGSAVDASIATILCLCVVHPHNTGIGGGGFMLVHDHKKSKTISFDFQETTPLNFTNELSVIGIPGLLHGLSTAHKQYGKLLWNDIVEPAVNIAKNGFTISSYLEEAIKSGNYNRSIRDIFYTKSGTIKKNLKSPILAKTLNKIAKKGAREFYRGTIGKNIIKDVNNEGENFVYEDLANYTTIQTEPLKIKWKDYVVESTLFPSNGPIVMKTLKLLENMSSDNSNETFLWGKNIQMSSVLLDEIADSNQDQKDWSNIFSNGENMMSSTVLVRDFDGEVQEDKGSSVVAVDNEELFVSLISGLGSLFGSQIITSDGVIMNDALRNPILFTYRPTLEQTKNSSENYVRKPYTTLTPIIITEENSLCGLRLATSSSSSSLLTQFLLYKLLLHLPTSEAIASLNLNVSFHENEMYNLQDHRQPDVLKFVQSRGYHKSSATSSPTNINVIAKNEDHMEAFANFQGNGSVVEL